MFYVEYIENGERKALNLATCQSLETKKEHRSSGSTFCIIVTHKEFSKMTIDFETEEELLETFDKLMNAVKECQAHWKSPKALRDSS